MYTAIDTNNYNDINKYDSLQYEDFEELAELFKEYIFGLGLEFWEDVVKELESVLNKCDEIDYQSDPTAIAYSLWHFLDRYHRVQIMCKFLLAHGYLNRAKQYDILDVGTGPSQVLFALSDHFRSLNRIEKKVLCTVNPDYVEQSYDFRNFLHRFVEFTLSKGTQYLVPFHFGRTQDAFDIKFNEYRSMAWGLGGKHSKYIKYRYDITVFNNFLTTKTFVEAYADTLRQICKYTRNHGLVIIVGASEKSKKYQEMYPVIDDIVLSPVKDRGFYSRWDKVFDQEFNYKFDDKYGEIIGNYFNDIIMFLQENDLWKSVPQNAQKEFNRNTKVSMAKNSTEEWGGISWKMVVYRKISKPHIQTPSSKKIVHRNFYKLVDDVWKKSADKNI